VAEQFEKDFLKLQNNLKKIANSLNDQRITLRLARKVREIVYRRVKSGYGVDDDSVNISEANKVKLKELSQSYKDYRNGLVVFYTNKNGNVIRLGAYDKKKSYGRTKDGGLRVTRQKVYNEKLKITPPKLGDFGRPDKSNLTLSGQMLDAMVIQAGNNGFRVFIADTARKKVHPKQQTPNLTNKQVAEYVSLNGRPFMALTAGEVRILKQECETIIKEQIAKLIR
jgi:hypothetical protein